ncbi:mitochondrial uncoupling protein 4 [Papilio machaon]|uniref:mitochondrial uncoupling protein 4 n=1 Tax=Papilio machaon TaxID=76193 RepID=UPI001E6659D6|nr:mitochondrial uncoupling protein 4 [Papilio machaon]XP_045535506.1 mitochondrial uncoupling protein 4 [Papilio machaon]XP_045535507.1 mitochondrial uncoupling protein 4 [Papilio machaon]XP_045535508.1 mitochondrial uncoupling protein 4 [Papilio machaon]
MAVLRNVDNPANKATDSVALRYAVAVLAAWAAELITYPFDLTKTRLQIQSEVATAKQGFKLENIGMIGTASKIVKNEGVLKLWSGLMPMLQRHAIYSGCRLIFYERFRNALKDGQGNTSLAAQSLCGASAGALSQLIASPTDLVKVQMQAEGRRLLQGKRPRFANCRQAYSILYSESGIRGFWRGAIPNAQRAALVNLGDLAAYDSCKRLLVRDMGMTDSPLVHTLAAFAAGFVAAVMGTPADVMKTRLMNQPVGPDGRGLLYRGLVDCVRQSVKNEGVLTLYKGFLPTWVRMGPWALVNWVAFENIMLAVGGKPF